MPPLASSLEVLRPAHRLTFLYPALSIFSFPWHWRPFVVHLIMIMMTIILRMIKYSIQTENPKSLNTKNHVTRTLCFPWHCSYWPWHQAEAGWQWPRQGSPKRIWFWWMEEDSSSWDGGRKRCPQFARSCRVDNLGRTKWLKKDQATYFINKLIN